MPDSRNAVDPRDAARGRWHGVLTGLGGIDSAYLVDKHGPCPVCPGGEDRFRWDDRDGDGGGYCNVCGGVNGAGGSISGAELLMRARGWTFPEAMDRLREHLGIESEKPVRTLSVQPRRKTQPAPPKPQSIYGVELAELTTPFPPEPPATLPNGAILDYSPRQRVKVGRAKDGGKAFFASHLQEGKWERGAGPDPWPLWREADALASGCGKWIVEAEGEKCADWVRAGGLVAVSQPGHSRKVEQIANRYQWLKEDAGVRGIVFLSDNDEQGLKRAADAAKAAATVEMPFLHVPAVDVWPEIPEKGSIDDAPGAAADRVDALIEAVEAAVLAEEAEEAIPSSELQIEAKLEVDGPPTKRAKAKDEWPFTLLGFAGNDYYYQPGDSGQVLSIAGGQGHSPANLIRLADLGWWEDQFPRYNAEGERMGGANWQDAWNTICRQQHKVGVYDPRRIRGLGAWWDDGRVVYHLGDRLIVGGAVVPVLEAPAGRYLYQRLPRKDGPGNVAAMTADEGLGLAMLAERFRWDASASARLLMGWIALAPIAGALEWRPHTWISGVSGSGKTTVVNMVVLPLLGDMALFALGNTTEAGLRQTLKSDSLPVVFDEAESNQRQDAARMQNVLALARAASAETGAHQYKGSARGEAMMFEIRSMFMMSSINSALKEGADRSRFSSLLLRSAVGDDTERWEALERDIALACTKETGKRLIARMVRLVPMVRQVAVQMARVVAMELKGGARMGQQVGALLAGYWCLCNDEPPTEEEALGLVRDVDWEEHGGNGDERGGDQGDLLATLLEARLTVEAGSARRSMTVSELCSIAMGTTTDLSVDPMAARMELGRNGIAAKDDRVFFSNTAKGLERILRDTPWAIGGNWRNLLRELPGAAPEKPMRFQGVPGTSRAVSVPVG